MKIKTRLMAIIAASAIALSLATAASGYTYPETTVPAEEAPTTTSPLPADDREDYRWHGLSCPFCWNMHWVWAQEGLTLASNGCDDCNVPVEETWAQDTWAEEMPAATMPTEVTTVEELPDTSPVPVAAAPFYAVLESFEEWTGKGNAVARIDANHEDFDRLMLNGVEVAAASYSVAEGSTILTLNETYLRTLSNGEHTFVAEFTRGYTATVGLTVNNTPTPAPPAPPAPDSNPKTGIALAVTPLILAGGIAVIAKKRK